MEFLVKNIKSIYKRTLLKNSIFKQFCQLKQICRVSPEPLCVGERLGQSIKRVHPAFSDNLSKHAPVCFPSQIFAGGFEKAVIK